MWSKVEAYINKHKLLETSNLYLTALSGGADSVALLLLLKEGGFNVHAAHCNFRLRGAESDRDEAFCVELCRQQGVELHRAHFDTREYAAVHKASIEMAARELRYRWFSQLREDIGASGVCVAHHRDDSVETVLLNLVRGTGLRGLTGIQPRNGDVLRPLLCVSRAEIEQYLTDRGQGYVTDSTNLEADVMRNKIRLQLIPLLKTLNPSVCSAIAQMADNVSGAQQVLDDMLKQYKNCNILKTSELGLNSSREYIAFEWLKNYGFNGTQVRQILEAETGAAFHSSKGYDVLADRGRLIVESSLKPMKPVCIPEPGTYILEDEQRVVVREEPVWTSKAADCVTVDASKVTFPLTVRRVAEGDKMVPFGVKGSKLLSDLMTDRKMTLFEKRRQLVVVDANGHIVWLVGIRIDERFRVTDATSSVLRIEKK